jgi:hypothetical protein
MQMRKQGTAVLGLAFVFSMAAFQPLAYAQSPQSTTRPPAASAKALPKGLVKRPVPEPKRPLTPEPSYADEIDSELRKAAAERLAKLGFAQHWEVYSLDELLDKENRIRSAEHLRSHGLDLNWATHTAAEMLEYEKRIIRADRLRLMGKVVDWKTYTSDQLADMEIELCRLQARR